MFDMSVRKWNTGASVFAAAMLLTSCAVGPDFLHPEAPEITRYTTGAADAAQTSSTDAANRTTQRFVQGRDIPQGWWALYKSPALNALIERALNNNPSTAIGDRHAARLQTGGVRPGGQVFPLVQANFNPTRQLTAGSISPVLSSGANPFNLYTAQLQVSYTFDVWGLNRRTVESLQAHGRRTSASRSRRPISR